MDSDKSIKEESEKYDSDEDDSDIDYTNRLINVPFDSLRIKPILFFDNFNCNESKTQY